MKKKIEACAFVLVVVLSLVLSNSILKVKSADGIKQAEYMYYQPRNTVDVAFIGSSHVHCNVNTAMLWKDYGIAAYDYSAAEQPLWITYYYLKELLKYQSPGLVVMDLYTPARFKEYYRYRWIRDNLYGVRFSVNKLQMVFDSVEKDKISMYFPSFAGYHGRFKELGWADLKYLVETPKERASFKGYTPYFEVLEQGRPVITETGKGGLTPKSEEYLLKIIDLCKEKNIDLYFIVTPYTITNDDQRTYNQIGEIAKEYGIEVFNANEYIDEMNIDYSLDFNDYSHLNYGGSCKFTEYLEKLLKDKFEIPDRRGNKKYLSWDRHCENIDKLIE